MIDTANLEDCRQQQDNYALDTKAYDKSFLSSMSTTLSGSSLSTMYGLSSSSSKITSIMSNRHDIQSTNNTIDGNNHQEGKSISINYYYNDENNIEFRKQLISNYPVAGGSLPNLRYQSSSSSSSSSSSFSVTNTGN